MKNKITLLFLLLSAGFAFAGCQQKDESANNVSEAKKSQSLTELSKEAGELKEQDCSDKLKNEQGICEVPNHPHPEQAKQKKESDNH